MCVYIQLSELSLSVELLPFTLLNSMSTNPLNMQFPPNSFIIIVHYYAVGCMILSMRINYQYSVIYYHHLFYCINSKLTDKLVEIKYDHCNANFNPLTPTSPASISALVTFCSISSVTKGLIRSLTIEKNSFQVITGKSSSCLLHSGNTSWRVE